MHAFNCAVMERILVYALRMLAMFVRVWVEYVKAERPCRSRAGTQHTHIPPIRVSALQTSPLYSASLSACLCPPVPICPGCWAASELGEMAHEPGCPCSKQLSRGGFG